MSARRASRPQPTSGATLRSRRGLTRAQLIIAIGVGGACAVVPMSMAPGGYNPFGPIKAVLLALSVAAVLAGMALEPGAAIRSIRIVAARKATWFLGGYVLLGVLATLTSLDMRASVLGSYPDYQGVLALVMYLVVALGGVVLAKDGEPGYLARALCVAMLAVGLYALAQMVGLDPLTYRAGLDLGRARSTLGNASNLGLWLVLALPHVIGLMRESRGTWRWAAGIAAGVGVVALLGSSSRGAWLGALVAVAVWIALEAPAWAPALRRKVVLVTASIAIVGLVAVVLLAPSVASRATSALDTTSGTALWRYSVWSSAIEMSKERPVLGWGPNTFRFAYPLYRGVELSADSADPQIVADAHNLFVNTLAERGPVAVLALAGWLIALGVGTVRAARIGGSASRSGSVAAGSIGAERIALAATASSLAGGLAAANFHFLTLDTGALFFSSALLLTWLTAPKLSAAPSSASEPVPMTALIGLWVGAGLSLILGFALVGVLVGDWAIARGFAKVDANSSTQSIAEEFARARSAAPWDAVFRSAEGRAMLLHLQSGAGGTEAYESGARALVAAEALTPHDTRLFAEHADLVLAAALAQKDPALFEDAYGRYDALVKRDPYNGPLWIGRGSSSAGMDRWEDAVADYEKGVALASGSIVGWSNLAVAYGQVGRVQDAADAKRTAEELGAGLKD